MKRNERNLKVRVMKGIWKENYRNIKKRNTESKFDISTYKQSF